MSDVTTCRACGLPRFHGPAGYAGAQCLCPWKGATPPQMYDEMMALQRLLDDVRDVRNADDVAFGWDEAAEYFGTTRQRM